MPEIARVWRLSTQVRMASVLNSGDFTVAPLVPMWDNAKRGRPVARVPSPCFAASVSVEGEVRDGALFAFGVRVMARRIGVACCARPAVALCGRAHGHTDGVVCRCGGRTNRAVHHCQALCGGGPGVWCRNDRGRQD